MYSSIIVISSYFVTNSIDKNTHIHSIRSNLICIFYIWMNKTWRFRNTIFASHQSRHSRWIHEVIYMIHMIHILRFRACKFFTFSLNFDCLEFSSQSLVIRTETSTATLAMAFTATWIATNIMRRSNNLLSTNVTTCVKTLIISAKISEYYE